MWLRGGVPNDWVDGSIAGALEPRQRTPSGSRGTADQRVGDESLLHASVRELPRSIALAGLQLARVGDPTKEEDLAAAAVVPSSSTAACAFCTTVWTLSGSLIVKMPRKSAASVKAVGMPSVSRVWLSWWVESKVTFGSARSSVVGRRAPSTAASQSGASPCWNEANSPAAGSSTSMASAPPL